uniref:Forkhead domain-containing protein n=1 Tax=Coccidioides posadasii RMSCC 3488 TaxID=454284 RepID=A0A0J6FJF7_COCPO|nr:hypothetical protein CPAG_09590 [Coccidioides posadasii RMSCC 3488]
MVHPHAMSSSQTMAASLLGQRPHDAASERSAMDLQVDRCEQSKPPAASDVTPKLEASNNATADQLKAVSESAFLALSDDYKKQTEREKQNAASALLAQLLSSKPLNNSREPDQNQSSTEMELDEKIPQSRNPSPRPSPQTQLNGDNPPIEQAPPPTCAQADATLDTSEAQKATEDNLMPEASQEDSIEREHNLILDAIQSNAKANPDFIPMFSDFTPLPAARSAKEALLQSEILTDAYFSAVGGPTPRIVGYPELPTQKDAKGTTNDSGSVSGSEPRIQAYAKLEFDDGHFYVNTYSFILGRDVRAARAAFQRELQLKQQKAQNGNGVRTPKRIKPDNNHTIMGSVISDTGGIMGFDPDVPQHCPPQMSWKSSNSSNGHHSHPMLHMTQAEPDMSTPVEPPRVMKDYNALAMESLQNGNEPKRVDTLALLPTPDSCPIIPIHPPASANGVPSSHRGISRKHVKIAYNFHRNVFEMEVMGRNGAFMGADWLAPGQVRPLHSGDFIQIGGVRVRFLLPDVPIGGTGSEATESPVPESNEAARSRPEGGSAKIESEGEADNSGGEDSARNKEAGKVKVKKLTVTVSGQKPSTEESQTPQPARRRGPGRPPKDGIMSKRERAEIAREQKLAARREANGGVTPPPTTKSKASKPGKDGEAEDQPAVKPEKRKYTKRKRPDSAPGDSVVQSIEGGDGNIAPGQEEPIKPAPVKKRKPSRSPSPDYPPESFYTPKELAKPPYNYAVLIYDALSESPTPMTLKQIYRALKLKYPYFRFRCETEGWTSSVRHNLNGNNHLFMHAERDGKGWSWKLIPGASVDKEKKRRPSPPPQDITNHNNQPFLPPSAVPQYTIPHGMPAQHPPPQYPYQPITQHPTPMAPPPLPPPPPARRANPFPFTLPHLPQTVLPEHDLPRPFSLLRSPVYSSPYSSTPPPPHFPHPRHRRAPPQPPPQRRQPPPSAPVAPPPQNYNAPSIIKFQSQPYNAVPHPSQPPPQAPPPPPPAVPIHPMPPAPPPPPQNTSPISSLSLINQDPAFLSRANQAIDNFEAVLMEDYEDQEYIKKVLRSARDRVLNGAKESSFPGGEPKDEAVIINALRGIIGQLTGDQSQAGIP